MSKKILNIAFFNKELPSDRPNGVSIQVHRLANELASRGHSVTCFSFSPKPDDAAYYHTQLVYKQKMKLLKKFEPAFQFAKILKDKFDIVHYHGDDYLVSGSLNRVRTFYGSALSEAIHAKSFSRKLYQLLFYIFEIISNIKLGYKTGISKSSLSDIPFLKNSIYCGVPEKQFVPKNIKTTHPSLLFLGDINSRKNGRFLLDVFEKNIIKILPDCTLTVIGPESCSGKNIIYLGNISQSDLIEEYNKAWVFCVPSSYEGFGVPVIEALACRTAVCVMETPALHEIIPDEISEVICNNSDYLGMVIKLLTSNSLRNRIEEIGYEHILDNFTISKTANKYELIYYDIMERNNE